MSIDMAAFNIVSETSDRMSLKEILEAYEAAKAPLPASPMTTAFSSLCGYLESLEPEKPGTAEYIRRLNEHYIARLRDAVTPKQGKE